MVNLPVLPWALSPQALVLDKSLEERFPDGDLISPVILAPATRAIYDLLATGDQGGRPRYIKIEKALVKNQNWRRQGVYLTADSALQENWISLWQCFLGKGYLLPPSPKEPLILPGMLSPGEESALTDLLLNRNVA